MAMSKERQGEIARMIVKREVASRGIVVGEKLRRELGSEAQRIGLAPAEYLEFYTTMATELFNESFGEK